MKRYWLFASAHYYPNGGLGDLEGTFDTWEESLLCIEKEYGEGNEWCRDKDDYEFEIFDSEKHIRYNLDVCRERSDSFVCVSCKELGEMKWVK